MGRYRCNVIRQKPEIVIQVVAVTHQAAKNTAKYDNEALWEETKMM